MSPAPQNIHQLILNKINYGLLRFLDMNNAGEVRIAPYDVYLSHRNILQPDIIFIANENLHLIEEKGLVGVPDIVVEILSPGTAYIDAGKKKDIYEEYGVKEYFMVDPVNKNVTALILKEKQFIETEQTTGSFFSNILNTTIIF